MTAREQLEHAIAALESQRATLGDVAVDAALAALHAIHPGLKNLEDGLRAARPMPAPLK